MTYTAKYHTSCPKCGVNDCDGDNLAVYEHGTSYCWACKVFIDKPGNNNNRSFLDTSRESVGFTDEVKITESVVGEGDITDKEVIKYLWQFHLYKEDWELHGLKQIKGHYKKIKEFPNQVPKVSIIPTLGIIIPTYGGYIIRRIDGAQPKVISSHFSDHWQHDVYSDKDLVLCEDVFSGMKLAKAGLAVIALCGTSLHPWAKYYLAKYATGRKVFSWLDNDAAGKLGTEKVVKYVEQFTSSTIISSKCDPKWYEVKDIKEIVYDRKNL